MHKAANYYRPMQYKTEPVATDTKNIKFPFSKDVEEVVLGSMIMDFEACKLALAMVSDVDFYTPIAKGVIMAINSLSGKGEPINILTVTNECRYLGVLESIGGAFAVTNLTTRVGSTQLIERDCLILKQYSIRRQFIQAGLDAIAAGQDDTQDGLVVLDRIKQDITNIYNNMPASQVTAQSIAAKVLSEYENIEQGVMVRNFTQTGTAAIDNVIGGLPESGLVFILAAPSVGKTTIALQWCMNIAKTVKCSFISLETDSNTITRMLIGNSSKDLGVTETRIYLNKIKDNGSKLNLQSAAKADILKNIALHEDFSSELTNIIKLIYTDVNNGTKVIFIDYVQLISTNYFGNGNEKLEHICKKLQGVSRDLNVPIVVLSQRGRPDDRAAGVQFQMPTISDARGSGGIEQSARMVIAFCLERSSSERMANSDGKVHYRYMQASVLKNKNGGITIGRNIPLLQIPAIYTVQTCTPEYEQDYLACCGGDASNDLTSRLLSEYGIRNPYQHDNNNTVTTETNLSSIADILVSSKDPYLENNEIIPF